MALFHLHKRKRFHLPHLEDFPSKKKWKRYLDTIIYAAGIAGPIITIPQIWQIWHHQNASGVSLTSWTGYLFIAVIWLFYGIVHKEKPIIVMYVANIIVQFFVVLGIIIYKKKKKN